MKPLKTLVKSSIALPSFGKNGQRKKTTITKYREKFKKILNKDENIKANEKIIVKSSTVKKKKI